ncbi:MAG: hypothetical protein M3083_12190 [Actinomycetota bacterium]|nr:hypothetical protein [Actinomycetota bacterium]MDQ6946962.1 hypothetical protein [Actinomycetota bacterium]
MPGIINGRSWLSTRRDALQAGLAKDPPDEQRAAIEAELAAVDRELATSRHRWWRWLLPGSQPPS